MPSLTGLQLVTGSFNLLNVFLPGESIPNADAQTALTAANDLLSSWEQRYAFAPLVTRNRFDLSAVTGKGGPDNPYTMGTGGDFNVPRPANQNMIRQANLILTASSPEVRIPLGIYTDDAYNANQVPGQTNTQPTGIYYNATYQNDLGSLFIWPVVNTALNDLELFIQQPVAQFPDLSTTMYVPSGLPLALKFNVAQLLEGTYGKQLTDRQNKIAESSLNTFKRSNQGRLVDVQNDAAGIGSGGGRFAPYNIVSDS